MIKVKIIKEESGNKVGDVIEVTKNIAHGLIDRGVAKIYKKPQETPQKEFKSEKDKMLTPKKGKGYRVK